MKNPIENLNKVFDSRIRLGVMSILMVNAEVSFNDLKQMMDVADGNLASHLVNLEENGFIKVHKGFIGRKTNTTYSITKAGEKAFKEHLEALENMIRGTHKSDPATSKNDQIASKNDQTTNKNDPATQKSDPAAHKG